MEIVSVACVAHKEGMQRSIRSSSVSTVPYSREKFNNLLPTFFRCAAVNYYTLYSAREMGIYYDVTVPQICCPELHCIKFNVPGTNFGIKKLRGKNALLENRTRSNLTQSVYATTKLDVLCLRHLQGVDRQENACSPVAYISDFNRVSSHAFQLAEK